MKKSSPNSYFGTCPACGGEVLEHLPPTDEDYESWRFACYGEILRMGWGFSQAAPCQDAIRLKLNTINAALTRPLRPDDPVP